MALDLARGTLYRGTINLWVEDELTRAYLSEIWNDPAIAFFIGGGNEGVSAIVHDAEESGFQNVFALIDRDFRTSNHEDWSNPVKTFRKFILPVHEIENYLLDPAALHACRYHNRGLSADTIEVHLRQAAERLTWWAACRSVIAELKVRFREGFIRDPAQTITDESSARHHIINSIWFTRLENEVRRSTIADIERLLHEAHVSAAGRLGDGTWRGDFAGKELFRDVLSRICDRPKISGFPPRDEEFYSDVAKEVAALQLANAAVPQSLLDLRNALRRRVSLGTDAANGT